MTTDIPTDVRIAREEDLEGMLACHGRAGEANPNLRSFLEASVGTGHSLVAEQGEEVVGYAVRRSKTFFGRDFVELLMVRADHRRRGVGKALLRKAVEASDTSQVFTSTNQSNQAMRSLLEREGWILSGLLEGLDEGDPERVYYRDAGAAISHGGE